MRWNIESKTEYVERLSKWHRWLAWHPIRVVNSETKRTQLVWLETVWRRGEFIPGQDMLPDRWRWRYMTDPADFELMRTIEEEKD